MALTSENSLAFSEFFLCAEARGLDMRTVARGLLRNVREETAAQKVFGLRRRRIADGDGWKNSPPDPLPRPVPISVWELFEDVDARCVAEWVDDPHEIENYGIADLLSGTVTTVLWELQLGPQLVETTFAALRIETKFAQLILDDPEAVILPTDRLRAFTDAERLAWIADRGRSPGGQDLAFNEYRNHPRYDGTKQAVFRGECTAVWGQSNGRPARVR